MGVGKSASNFGLTSESRPRIGILNGGGDCPGLNAVIRGVVKAGTRLGYEIVGFLKGFEGLTPDPQYRILTQQNTGGILIQGGTILGTTNRGRFGIKVGTGGQRKLPNELIEDVRRTFEELGLVGLIVVGGDGTLTIAHELFSHGFPIVGVPKTIDNDLGATAYTFGFDSAVACAADALDRLHTTAASHDRVMVLEVMGRHAGWIALHAGIAGGADIILIPEIAWDYDALCHKVRDRQSQGKLFTIVVVAEGASLPDGGLVAREAEQSERQTRLGGIGQIVADELQQRTGQETRCVVLGHLQRGGAPTTFDRCLATQFGAHAVGLVVDSRFGQMVCFEPPEIASVALASAIEQLRTVSPQCSAVRAARAMGISFGDRTGYDNPFMGLAPIDRPAG
jgi:6-phosphofructokinase 1